MSTIPKNPNASQSNSATPPKPVVKPKPDDRLPLFNDGKWGPIQIVQRAECEITTLRGILLDFDLKWFRAEALPAGALTGPEQFYQNFLRGLLARHPVFHKAEVRNSGQGIHLIVRFDPLVEFETENDRQRWAGIVRVIQKLLPTDPDCPGITACSRPLGSVNTKNGAVVTMLNKGQPVKADEVIELFEQARTAPFRTVAQLLFGDEHVIPCPVCRGDGSKLDALDYVGKCYGSCGKVRIGQLFDLFLKQRPSKKTE